MKQKSQNRFLAALLAVAMMLQMLPMLAFAEDALGTGEVRNKRTGTTYTSLATAVAEAQSGDTIELGEGNYTLYGVPSVGSTQGKDLTFVGQGTDKTAWNIGDEVPDPNKFGTEYNGDYSFDGAKTVTFKNMTLRSGKVDYLGFIRIDNTVVENCVINGKTDYWGYTSAVFKDTTFNAPSSNYALWTYCSPTMTFDTCTFNANGKAINVYTDYSAGAHDITVNFNNCTVNSNFQSYVSMFSNNKTALNINDSNMGSHTLTVTGGTFAVKNGGIDVTDTLETSTDEASGKQTCLVPDGAEVTVTLDQTKVPEGMVFDLWSTGELPLDQDYKAESIAFTMNGDVDVAAQYRSADIEDGSDVVGPIIVGTAVVAGGALVGYTLGTDLVGQMWGLPYFPSNRSALAMMLWEDAGKPMPESEILYPDVGQEEQDMDLQHAARWAMEHDLMPDLNDQDTELPPEQVKFYPDNMVTKISVLRAWKKAQDLKQNAQ